MFRSHDVVFEEGLGHCIHVGTLESKAVNIYKIFNNYVPRAGDTTSVGEATKDAGIASTPHTIVTPPAPTAEALTLIEPQQSACIRNLSTRAIRAEETEHNIENVAADRLA